MTLVSGVRRFMSMHAGVKFSYYKYRHSPFALIPCRKLQGINAVRFYPLTLTLAPGRGNLGWSFSGRQRIVKSKAGIVRNLMASYRL
jgi:hypothetical protein